MADPTYESEINQPAHRPGMEGAVSRGPQHAVPSEGDPRDSSGNRQGGRRTVSPPTRSAFGADSASDPAPHNPAASGSSGTPDELPVGSGGRAREAAIDEVVSKAGG
jgi:hypothetical protein